MKTQTLYVCEHCNTSYADKHSAEQCEKNHKKKLKIVDQKSQPYSMDKSGFPIKISVKDEDGTVKLYKRI